MSAAALRLPLAAEAIPGVWRGARPQALKPTEPTGSQPLDAALLGGWPKGALTQIVSRHEGFGFSLILPLLARLTSTGQHTALVHTPFLPCAPALDARGVNLARLLWVQPESAAQALWAVEQLLRSGLMTAIAFWNPQPLDGNTERRLQLAAETSRCAVFAFRSGAVEAQSYAALKLAVAPAADARIAVEVLKCQGGGRSGQRLNLQAAFSA